MDENSGSDEVFSEVEPTRRGFVKGIVAVTAFSAPFIASYDLESLSPSLAHAQMFTNVPPPPP
jgi:hypothetical protein